MAGILYSKLSGKNDAIYGKFEHPIKALIENESNICEKKKDILKVLFNIENSNRYAETFMGETGFDTFQAAGEGQRAENDDFQLAYKKTIEHIQFMKEFTITKQMADDAIVGKVVKMGANMKNRPKEFTRAYYRTRAKLGAWALSNGTVLSGTFNKARVDLTVGDGKALFANNHTFAAEKFKDKTQSNYYWDDKLCSSTAEFEKSLNILSNKMRNFKDENGETMDYVADVVIIPCNRPNLEAIAKKVIGSERTTGTDHNDINTQYGNWSLVVLPGWETTDDRFMVMSSDANQSLMGNIFTNRVKLDIQNEVDIHTRNFIWNGYCRFGVGFTTWKHILLAVDASAAVTGATDLAI